MWEWILQELNNAYKNVYGKSSKNNSKVNADDVISEVCMVLIQNPTFAHEIYIKKKTWLLAKLIRTQIYENYSKVYFDNKTDYSRYQHIIEICNTYNIAPVSENAYKISAVMNNTEYGINRIERLLNSVKKEEQYLDSEKLSE